MTRGLRLFNKNIGDRKSERMRMVAESCPVAVSEYLFQWEEGPLNGGGNHDPLKVITKNYCCLNQIRLFAGTSVYLALL